MCTGICSLAVAIMGVTQLMCPESMLQVSNIAMTADKGATLPDKSMWGVCQAAHSAGGAGAGSPTGLLPWLLRHRNRCDFIEALLKHVLPEETVLHRARTVHGSSDLAKTAAEAQQLGTCLEWHITRVQRHMHSRMAQFLVIQFDLIVTHGKGARV